MLTLFSIPFTLILVICLAFISLSPFLFFLYLFFLLSASSKITSVSEVQEVGNECVCLRRVYHGNGRGVLGEQTGVPRVVHYDAADVGAHAFRWDPEGKGSNSRRDE